MRMSLITAPPYRQENAFCRKNNFPAFFQMRMILISAPRRSASPWVAGRVCRAKKCEYSHLTRGSVWHTISLLKQEAHAMETIVISIIVIYTLVSIVGGIVIAHYADLHK